MCNYLTKRGSTYYFRRKVPNDLIELLNKREITLSLKTKNRQEAINASHQHSVDTDNLFESARSQNNQRPDSNTVIATAPSPSSLHSIGAQIASRGEINALIHYYINAYRNKRAQKNPDESVKYTQGLRRTREEALLFATKGEYSDENPPYSITQAEAIIHAINYTLDHTPPPYFPPPVNHQAAVMAPIPKPDVQRINIISVVEKWHAERQPNDRTYTHTKRIVQKFCQITEKTFVDSFTKSDIVKFKDALIHEGSSISNTNNYLSLLNTILNFSFHQAYINSNPATGVRVKGTNSAKAARLPFDNASLKKIFSSPVYSNNYRPAGGKGEASYWLPLLALYTGARLEELCQLRTNDIYEEDYLDMGQTKTTWVIHITDEGEGQHLKNKNSKRKVPVHQDLLDLGLINFVNNQANGYIFHELKPTKVYAQRGGNWSKWFSRYLRETIGIKDTKLVFHSFRHTFKHLARLSGVPTEVHHAITGHTMGNVGDNYGDIYYPLAPLVAAMNSYNIKSTIM